MTAQRCLALRLMVFACLGVFTTSATASINTFTSGTPPIGDGNLYPRSVNPARQAIGGGASPDTYFDPNNGVGFFNLNGNPAFFDANNLLTRPAQLLSGEAFWTDPKIGNFIGPSGNPFSLAHIGFDLGFPESDFGFDMAIASVSTDLPTSLRFQIQDEASNTAQGRLLFEIDSSGDGGSPGEIIPDLAGTFFTLNSPRVAYEARYRIPYFDLVDLLANENDDYDFDNPSPIRHFDIFLEDIATGGGTTQIAIDNFVIGDTAVLNPTAEPTYIPVIGPIGDNRPQLFTYALEDLPPDAPDDIFPLELADLGDRDFTALTVIGEGLGALEEVGARAHTRSTSVYFETDNAGTELFGHEITHTLQGSGNTDLPPNQTAIEEAAATRVDNLVNTAPNPAPGSAPGNALGDSGTTSALTRGTAPSPQIIEVTTVLQANPTDNALQQAFQQAALQAQATEQAIQPANDDESVRLELVQLTEQTLAELAGDAGLNPPSYYLNYSAQQYLALKTALGDAMLLGDGGSTVVPVFNNAGGIVTYAVTAWLVSDQSGLFQSVITVPEPASLLALAAMVGLVRTPRRQR